MLNLYSDYRWKEGFPIGTSPLEESLPSNHYKIVSDPYHKKISIEKYADKQFIETIYDTALLDFRSFKRPELTAWQKEVVSEGAMCLIRNQDDRIVFLETYQFVDHLCRQCEVKSPHGITLSIHRMYYQSLGDSFNGVVLYDSNERPVMLKKYEFDLERQLFTTLLEEQWEVYAKDII